MINTPWISYTWTFVFLFCFLFRWGVLQRVRHNWVTSLSLFAFTLWRKRWQRTPVFLPGESRGWGSLVGSCLWGCTESDTTEQLNWTEGWSSGLFKFPIQWDLCWVFFICLFFLWWARLSDGIILSADDWVCIFVLFFRWGLGDAWSCIQVVSFVFSLFDAP